MKNTISINFASLAPLNKDLDDCRRSLDDLLELTTRYKAFNLRVARWIYDIFRESNKTQWNIVVAMRAAYIQANEEKNYVLANQRVRRFADALDMNRSVVSETMSQLGDMIAQSTTDLRFDGDARAYQYMLHLLSLVSVNDLSTIHSAIEEDWVRKDLDDENQKLWEDYEVSMIQSCIDSFSTTQSIRIDVDDIQNDCDRVDFLRRRVFRDKFCELAANFHLTTLEEMSQHVGLSIGTIHSIIHGRVLPRVKNQRRIAEAFGITHEELMSYPTGSIEDFKQN